MFERLNTTEELFQFKLGAALKMETTVLEMLEDNIEAAKDDSLRELLTHHREETRGHVANIESAFGLLGWEVDDSPCPAIEGLEKEGKATLKKSDDSLTDTVILSAVIETEHHEIAVYRNLMILANQIGRDDVIRLLHQSFEQEEEALQKAEVAAGQPTKAGQTA
jgi:ferritin-like metal-binding protein YciE